MEMLSTQGVMNMNILIFNGKNNKMIQEPFLISEDI